MYKKVYPAKCFYHQKSEYSNLSETNKKFKLKKILHFHRLCLPIGPKALSLRSNSTRRACAVIMPRPRFWSAGGISVFMRPVNMSFQCARRNSRWVDRASPSRHASTEVRYATGQKIRLFESHRSSAKTIYINIFHKQIINKIQIPSTCTYIVNQKKDSMRQEWYRNGTYLPNN